MSVTRGPRGSGGTALFATLICVSVCVLLIAIDLSVAKYTRDTLYKRASYSV